MLRNWKLVALGSLATAGALTLALMPPRVVPTGDERDYLRAAIHIARSGVHSAAPGHVSNPPPDAFREPGYPFLLATGWRLLGVEPLAVEADRGGAAARSAMRVVRLLGGLLLAVAAAATASAIRAAGGSLVAVAASIALLAVSPALRQAALTPGSEMLAGALVALAAASTLRLATDGSILAVALAALFVGLAPLARGALVVLIPVGIAATFALRRELPRGRRIGHAVLFALIAIAPGGAWALRNLAVTGHPVLADRGGQVLWTRAELDRQLSQEGYLSALAAWTPIESVREFGARRWPKASILRYEWQGQGNFFTRSLRRWHADRRPPADALAADLRLGREAISQFARTPLVHLAAAAVVGWRGLFAERSPEAFVPVDLTFVLALFLATAYLAAAAGAIRDANRRLGVLLALIAVPFLFHALATEFLTRFSVPALPLLWGVVAMVLCDRRLPATRAKRA